MWRDSERLELMGLLDDPSMEALRSAHTAVYDALRNGEQTADAVAQEVVSEFDIMLEWLLRSSGVPV